MQKLSSLMLTAAVLVALALTGCSAKKAEPVKLTPAKAQELSQEGFNQIQKGNIEEASKALEQVAQSDLGDAKSYLLLGITRYQKKDLAGALTAYDKAISLDAKLADAYQGKANIYRDQKNLKEAEVWYRKAWAANPKFVDAYTELALQMNLNNRLPEAIAVLKEGVANIPDHADLRLMLASYYAQSGDTKAAKSEYEAVLKLNPSSQEAKNALAKLH